MRRILTFASAAIFVSLIILAILRLSGRHQGPEERHTTKFSAPRSPTEQPISTEITPGRVPKFIDPPIDQGPSGGSSIPQLDPARVKAAADLLKGVSVLREQFPREAQITYEVRLKVIADYDEFIAAANLTADQKTILDSILYKLSDDYELGYMGKYKGDLSPTAEAIKKARSKEAALTDKMSVRALWEIRQIVSAQQYSLFYQRLYPDIMAFGGNRILGPPTAVR